MVIDRLEEEKMKKYHNIRFFYCYKIFLLFSIVFAHKNRTFYSISLKFEQHVFFIILDRVKK